MNKYYDEKCEQCAQCGHYAMGAYPSGVPYEACRRYGYILHPEKGITQESCDGFQTPEQIEREKVMKEMSKRKGRR